MKQFLTTTFPHPHTQVCVLLHTSGSATLATRPRAVSQGPLVGADPHLKEVSRWGPTLQARLSTLFCGPASALLCLPLPHQSCHLEVLIPSGRPPSLALSGGRVRSSSLPSSTVGAEVPIRAFLVSSVKWGVGLDKFQDVLSS